MLKRIFSFIKENNLIIKEPIICATSGGVDSICLLHVLYDLGYKVVLAHVNHHKRQQSELEEIKMKELANGLNIPFELLSYHYDGEDNFHNDSHNARYNFFKELCIKYNTNTIASAHHLDDQIETVLMKIIEGSNLYGYGGISALNDDGEYRIIRPLLCVNKSELYEYAKKNNYEYFEDSSNQEDDFLRNRLRHHVIPLLKAETDDLGRKISEYSIQLKEAFNYVRNDSIRYLSDNDNKIDLKSYKELDIALKKDVVSLMFEKLNLYKNNFIINDCINLLESSDGSKSLDLNNGYKFVRSYNYASIIKNKGFENKELILNINNEVIFDNKYKFYFSKTMPNSAIALRLCYNKINLPFTIRGRLDGDIIKLNIGSKKVNRVLIDAKVEKDKRDRLPIVLDNNNDVLWVYNYAKSIDVVNNKDLADIYLICEVINNDAK